MIEDDSELIKAAKKNPEAFSALYEKYYHDIFLFIDRRVDDLQLAADLCSQVFLKAMTHLSSYKDMGLPFSAWLYRIATNHINAYYRGIKGQRTISLEDDRLQLIFDELPTNSVAIEPMELLIQLLDQLDDEELEILELRFFEQKPFKEVAYILDITENYAKVKTYRILEKMRKKAGV